MRAVIVWINGAFGSGKSTTADLLIDRLADAKLFDPEYVGYMLMPFLASPTGDFQDLPLWRHLVVEAMTGLATQYPHTWIAPMSLIRPDYRDEILGGIRAAGVEVLEVVLTLPEDRLRARIDADRVEVKGRQWRHSHIEQAMTTFATVTGAHLIDATRTPEEVVEAVATLCAKT